MLIEAHIHSIPLALRAKVMTVICRPFRADVMACVIIAGLHHALWYIAPLGLHNPNGMAHQKCGCNPYIMCDIPHMNKHVFHHSPERA